MWNSWLCWNEDTKEILLHGLEKLEYRGYVQRVFR